MSKGTVYDPGRQGAQRVRYVLQFESPTLAALLTRLSSRGRIAILAHDEARSGSERSTGVGWRQRKPPAQKFRCSGGYPKDVYGRPVIVPRGESGIEGALLMFITNHLEPWGVLRISSPYGHVDITQEALACAHDPQALINLAERQLINQAVNAGYISINDARMAMGLQPWAVPEYDYPVNWKLPSNWLELVVDEYE